MWHWPCSLRSCRHRRMFRRLWRCLQFFKSESSLSKLRWISSLMPSDSSISLSMLPSSTSSKIYLSKSSNTESFPFREILNSSICSSSSGATSGTRLSNFETYARWAPRILICCLTSTDMILLIPWIWLPIRLQIRLEGPNLCWEWVINPTPSKVIYCISKKDPFRTKADYIWIYRVSMQT